MKLGEIAIVWLAYFALHSLLASTGVKAWVGRRWPRLMPGYRALFNVIAAVTLLPVLWIVYGAGGDWLWQWRGAWAWLANGLALAAIVCFLASTRAYDMGEFLGVTQLEEHRGDDAQMFTLSIFHRFVRHPWYFFGLVLIWTRDMNVPFLVSALAISIYFVAGSKLEERKLIARYGDKYRRYMTKVPGLMPLPWKYLTAAEAEALIKETDE